MRLSIVVPMFNAERFIADCIETIHNQGLQQNEYEIIAIDDGSTDSTPQLCDRYAAQLSNFRVYHQRNAGAGAARNRGIDLAKGDYLYFFDVDDGLKEGTLRRLLDQCEEESLDVLFFGAEVLYESEDCKKRYPQDSRYFERRQKPGVVTGEQMFIAQQNDWNFCGQPCMLISRLRAVHKSRARFAEGIMNEDNFYVIRVTLHAERASVIPEPLYEYYVRPNTVTTSHVGDGHVFLSHLVLSREFEKERLRAIAAGKADLAHGLEALSNWFMDVAIDNCPEGVEQFTPFLDGRFASVSLTGRFAWRAHHEKKHAEYEEWRAYEAYQQLKAMGERADSLEERANREEHRAVVAEKRAQKAESRIAVMEASTTWKVGRVITAVPRAIKDLVWRLKPNRDHALQEASEVEAAIPMTSEDEPSDSVACDQSAQSNFVPASHVFVAQDLSSRDEVLRFISSKAVELGSATDEEELFQAFLRREAEGTTGMMEGFAIPHAKSSTVQEASAYVVKLAHGADDWETMDTASVTVVIGLLIPESKAGTEHLKLLSKIAEALMDDDFRAEIRATDDAEAIARATNARLV